MRTKHHFDSTLNAALHKQKAIHSRNHLPFGALSTQGTSTSQGGLGFFFFFLEWRAWAFVAQFSGKEKPARVGAGYPSRHSTSSCAAALALPLREAEQHPAAVSGTNTSPSRTAGSHVAQPRETASSCGMFQPPGSTYHRGRCVWHFLVKALIVGVFLQLCNRVVLNEWGLE